MRAWPIIWTMGMLALATGAAEVEIFNYDIVAVPDAATTGPVKPMSITGARNGTFSGAVAVKSAKPITGLKAGMGPLAQGDAVIPAAQLQVRYAIAWETIGGGAPGLDVLLEAPPESVPLVKNAAMAGVWVTVSIPENAKPGLYRGELTVEAAELPAQKVPVELSVSDWRVPTPQEQRTWLEVVQIPDTLSLEYKVPLWSDRHWEMIAKSFRLIQPTGSRVAYIYLLAETNHGNAESTIRWIKQADGPPKPDFSLMEKYLDVAEKNLGKLEMVVLYVWDVYLVTKFRKEDYTERPKVDPNANNYEKGLQELAVKRWDERQKGLTVTFVDPASGQTELDFLPHYKEEASKTLWRPVFTEIRQRLAKRGLEDQVRIGMITDMEPNKEEVLFLKDVTGNMSWIAHSHYRRLKNNVPSPNTLISGVADLNYEAHAYDVTYQVNPELGRMYGWNLKQQSAFLDRFGELNGSPLRVRQIVELNHTGQQNGVGRLGGDLWDCTLDKRGRRNGRTYSRYPKNWWRGLNIGSYLLAPGPDGPVATARIENLREGVEECEARICIESALLDPALKQRLGDDLANRAQKVLDEHQMAMWKSIWPNDEQLKILGAIHGRAASEAIWGALGKAGVKLPGFWDGSARKMRGEEDKKGIEWFLGSNWQERNRQLFAIAGEVQKQLGK